MEIREELEQFYRAQGYRVVLRTEEVLLCARETGGRLCGAAVVDLGTGVGFTAEVLASLREGLRLALRERSGEAAPEALLLVLLCESPETIRDAAASDRFCWLADKRTRRLLVYENQIPDFCGLRSPMEEWLAGGKGTRLRLRAPVTTGLVALNAAVFLLMMVSPAVRAFCYEQGALIRAAVQQGEIYRLFTSLFLHANTAHLFSNMILLYFVGEPVERRLGSPAFLLLYLAAGLAGNFASLAAEAIAGTGPWVSIGASGAIFGVMGAYLLQVLVRRGRRERAEAARIGLGIALCLYNGFASTGTNNAAHVGGLAGGLLFYLVAERTGLFRQTIQ